MSDFNDREWLRFRLRNKLPLTDEQLNDLDDHEEADEDQVLRNWKAENEPQFNWIWILFAVGGAAVLVYHALKT